LAPYDRSQMNLFDFGQSKWRKASDAMDKINDRYGEFVIVPAIMMGMQDTGIDRIAFGGVKELEDLHAM
jgi:DNA polymerase IV